MKTLTLWQPYASLVAMGEKRIETRSWSTSYRGPLAIHAGQALPKIWTPFKDEHFVEALAPEIGLNSMGAPNLDRLPRGVVLAIVNLVDVAPMLPWGEVLGWGFPTPKEEAFGRYDNADGQRYAWFFQDDDVQLVDPPIPCRGRQRLWELPVEVTREVFA